MPRHTLGDLQHAIMGVLWERGEATTAEVHEALREERGLAPTTIATMLRKMEDKGVVAHRAAGPAVRLPPHRDARTWSGARWWGSWSSGSSGATRRRSWPTWCPSTRSRPTSSASCAGAWAPHAVAGGSDGARPPLGAHVPPPQHRAPRSRGPRPPGPGRAAAGLPGGRAARRARGRLRDGQPAGRARRAADRRRRGRAGGASGRRARRGARAVRRRRRRPPGGDGRWRCRASRPGPRASSRP